MLLSPLQPQKSSPMGSSHSIAKLDHIPSSSNFTTPLPPPLTTAFSTSLSPSPSQLLPDHPSSPLSSSLPPHPLFRLKLLFRGRETISSKAYLPLVCAIEIPHWQDHHHWGEKKWGGKILPNKICSIKNERTTVARVGCVKPNKLKIFIKNLCYHVAH